MKKKKKGTGIAPIPDGWEVGWKVVTQDRRPLCSKRGIWWFDRTYSLGKEREFQRCAGEIVYKWGRYVVASNMRTGREFKSFRELLGYRRRCKIPSNGYGPAIHVYTDQITDDKAILVAYHPQEVVYEGSRGKIGVFKIKVLT